ncbi:MAG TPA: Crp/Fnr family transcriptional regulator [Aquabacterium sp.]|uniref:Crp/Fnr family transcriptional regulator n=1 Tax=Aquabacterium sp. TaxID=1872578 RepID=UPI002E315213|nr:Crp/Fnr family transcriptional regulator [Aquabacterium sp.]HEX5357961.1 Crp/Fnr family transcriptional regulator [Aquabacterium sp.]
MIQFHDTLLKDAWFASLPATTQQALLNRARLRHLDEGEALFYRGDPFAGLYCLIGGSIRICCATEDGQAAILAFVDTSQWFGEVGLFDRKSRSHDAVADRQTKVLHVPAQDIDLLLAQEPALWKHLGALAVQKMRNLFVGLEAYALKSGSVWVARRLLMIARQSETLPLEQGPRPQANIVPVSQDQLSQMLAKTRQTTNRMLRKLETEGVIRCGYRHIEILDWDALWQAAELHQH